MKPPPLPRAANGSGGSSAPPGAVPAPPVGAVDAPVEDLVLTKLRGAAQALPPSVAPTSVRAIRSGQLMRALSEALAPERRRFEEELARARQRALELEAELERIQAERKDVDETRRVELPRLAALVDRERTRAEELEREREAFAARVADLERELVRREEQARALESALPPAEQDEADVLARVQQRLDALAAAGASAAAPEAPVGAAAPELSAHATGSVGPSGDAAAGPSGADDALVHALLSSDARAVRIAALEQRVAALTGQAADLPGAEEPPAARAVVALLRASQEESRARTERIEQRVGELLDLTRDLHGALVEERRRRTLVEGALRAAQARLTMVEQREPATVRLPSFASVIKGDVGPLLDAVRDESRRRDESLEGRVQRLSLATRAALERMAAILDQALVAGLFDRDMPRLDPEALSAPLLEALDDVPERHGTDRWRQALDALDAQLRDDLDDDEDEHLDDERLDDEQLDDEGLDDERLDDDHIDPAGAPGHLPDEVSADEDEPQPLLEVRRPSRPQQAQSGHGGPPLFERTPSVPDASGRGDAPAGSVAPSHPRPPMAPAPASTSPEGAPAEEQDEGVFVEHLEDEPEEFASEEELAAWFRPGRPGQSETVREAEQLATFDLRPPPAPAPEQRVVTGPEASAFEPDLGELEGLDPAQADALRAGATFDEERRRLEERVRDAERALESEVWRGLATHRELVSTRQRLEELEAQLTVGDRPSAEPAAGDQVAATVGGLEAIADLEPLRDPASPGTAEHAAVLSLDVEDRDTWVHWLLLEHDPSYQARRARAVRACADAMRSADPADDGRRDELLHWLEGEAPPAT